LALQQELNLSMSDMILPFKGAVPRIEEGVFIAPNAAVIGDVEIGRESGIWYSVTLRGDVAGIRIGAKTNIQDGTVIHTASGDVGSGEKRGTSIGDGVTVGHCAVLHACTLEDGSFVGMGAVVLDGAVIESGAMVAAGALIGPNKRVAAGELWAGVPARCIRRLSPEEGEAIKISADHYVSLTRDYLAEG
jgi:gamma-carbonic anhydrase